MERMNICLLNDSFPPFIDGVANAVTNYANILTDNGHTASVVTPSNPKADDSAFRFPVLRYPSLPTNKLVGYRSGYPFSPETIKNLLELETNVIHSHCPFVSSLMARSLRSVIDAPLIFTYHTKFDIDIQNYVKGKVLQDTVLKILVQNISASDDVWVVSRGAGENLRSIGYQGDYIVMPNGVDCPRGRVDEAKAIALRKSLTEDGVPVFLYVGRMMWYKNLQFTLDALKNLKQSGFKFKMVFVGGGVDFKEIKKYAESNGLSDCCVFAGPIYDRELLRTYYCASDLFLFPSTYDTNGLVVREAAACGLPSILIEGSCAAEDVTDGRNGFTVKENNEDFCRALKALGENPDLLKTVGLSAMDELYLSWEDAVCNATRRYETVLERYRAGEYTHQQKITDKFFETQGKLMHTLSRVSTVLNNHKSDILK